MYSAHNEGNSVVSGKSIRSSKKKNYKYTTSIPKNVYISFAKKLIQDASNLMQIN